LAVVTAAAEVPVAAREALVVFLSEQGVAVEGSPVRKRVAAAASTGRTTVAASTAKKAPAKKVAASGVGTEQDSVAATTVRKSPARKPSAKKAAVKKATPPQPEAEVEVALAPTADLNGKKVLEDLPDEVFEKDLATDPTLKEDEKQGFTLSAADEADEPEQQVTVAGATADPVKDYLKQIGKVPLLNAAMEVELAKRIEAGLFSEEKLAGSSKIAVKLLDELEWIAEDGRRAKNHLLEANLRLVVSLAKRYTGAGCCSWTSSRRETSVSSVRSRSSTTPRATSSRRTRPGGSGRRSPAPWPTRPAPSASRCTWSRSSTSWPASSGRCCRTSAASRRPEELAKELDMTPEKVVEVQKYGREPISLHTPLGEDG
jgi:RNA polymerase primary sigma factor